MLEPALAPFGYTPPVGANFDPERHIYTLNGRELLGVTSVLTEERYVDYSHIPLFYRERGSAVHKACELDGLGRLDEASVADDVRPFLEGWRRFVREVEWISEGIEVPVLNEMFGYAGTLDLLGTCAKWPGQLALLDIKTGLPAWVARLQTAAYERAAQACIDGLPPYMHRGVVRVKGDGTYVCQWFDDPEDWSMWLNALGSVQIRRRFRGSE